MDRYRIVDDVNDGIESEYRPHTFLKKIFEINRPTSSEVWANRWENY